MRRLATLDELVGFSVVAAIVMSGVAGAVFGGVVLPLMDGTAIAPLDAAIALVLGLCIGPFCGLVSLAWLLPILRGHATPRSLAWMLVISGVVGTLAGCLHPMFGLLVTPIAQVAGALIVRYRGSKPRIGHCVHCDYDVRLASSDICPECGGVHTPG